MSEEVESAEPSSGSTPGRRTRSPNVGVYVRYLFAVPFLAAGAALLAIGALIAGTSAPPRKLPRRGIAQRLGNRGSR